MSLYFSMHDCILEVLMSSVFKMSLIVVVSVAVLAGCSQIEAPLLDSENGVDVGPDGKNDKVVFGGDTVLNRSDPMDKTSIAILENPAEAKARGLSAPYVGRWPGGLVNFFFDAGITADERNGFYLAMTD